MEKVKIIETNSSSELEQEINDFISYLNGEVIDIQYRMAALLPLSKFSMRPITIFTALIRYDD